MRASIWAAIAVALLLGIGTAPGPTPEKRASRPHEVRQEARTPRVHPSKIWADPSAADKEIPCGPPGGPRANVSETRSGDRSAPTWQAPLRGSSSRGSSCSPCGGSSCGPWCVSRAASRPQVLPGPKRRKPSRAKAIQPVPRSPTSSSAYSSSSRGREIPRPIVLLPRSTSPPTARVGSFARFPTMRAASPDEPGARRLRRDSRRRDTLNKMSARGGASGVRARPRRYRVAGLPSGRCAVPPGAPVWSARRASPFRRARSKRSGSVLALPATNQTAGGPGSTLRWSISSPLCGLSSRYLITCH